LIARTNNSKAYNDTKVESFAYSIEDGVHVEARIEQGDLEPGKSKQGKKADIGGQCYHLRSASKHDVANVEGTWGIPS